jgi:hypothetical protein
LVVDSVATPEARVPFPSEVLPSKKVTLPVAAKGVIVAVSFSVLPETTVGAEAASATDDDVPATTLKLAADEVLV